jgi:hypothetical protein
MVFFSATAMLFLHGRRPGAPNRFGPGYYWALSIRTGKDGRD